MKNTSNNNFLINFCFFSSLGLAACTSYRKAELGFLQVENQSNQVCSEPESSIEKREPQVLQQPSSTELLVHAASSIGECIMGCTGGMVGGAAGALIGGSTACLRDVTMDKAISNGAATGAYYGFWIGAPIGQHTARIATSGLILGGIYTYKAAEWLACNTYNGVHSIYSAMMVTPEPSTEPEPWTQADWVVIEPEQNNSPSDSSNGSAEISMRDNRNTVDADHSFFDIITRVGALA